jgi:hypothetical protein
MQVGAGERPANRTGPEDDMNENRERRGPNPALLLLIPAALIIAKGARRRRTMWASGGHGHHASFGQGGPSADERAAFRLPPKIEWMLDAWHTRAHEATIPSDTTAGDTATA